MPTRKQRRRRQKELRHEYEVVYLDEEGREVDAGEAELDAPPTRKNGKGEPKSPQQKGRSSRPVRKVDPPSWRRVAKRALIFGPLIFLAFSAIDSGQSIPSRLAVAAVYTAFFMPFMYLMDRAMYRAYLRRSGAAPTPQRPARKR